MRGRGIHHQQVTAAGLGGRVDHPDLGATGRQRRRPTSNFGVAHELGRPQRNPVDQDQGVLVEPTTAQRYLHAAFIGHPIRLDRVEPELPDVGKSGR